MSAVNDFLHLCAGSIALAILIMLLGGGMPRLLSKAARKQWN
ncbi:MAG: hypothetical protein R3E31_31160 [Chloroflexota bacterium]